MKQERHRHKWPESGIITIVRSLQQGPRHLKQYGTPGTIVATTTRKSQTH